MIDNRAMRPAILRMLRASFSRTTMFVVGVATAAAASAQAPEPGSLREKYPVASIDSVGRADAALAETAGAKTHIQLEYRNQARDCTRTFTVNACLDGARALQRKRLADIDGVELEANRFKRRDKADRLDADRTKRDAERAANAPADSDLRARNRQAYEERQAQAGRVAAERKRTEAATAAEPRKPRRSAKAPLPADKPDDSAVRRKNAVQHEAKLKEAAAHQQEIDRRVIAKTAERKRHAEERAAKDAKAAATAARAAAES